MVEICITRLFFITKCWWEKRDCVPSSKSWGKCTPSSLQILSLILGNDRKRAIPNSIGRIRIFTKSSRFAIMCAAMKIV